MKNNLRTIISILIILVLIAINIAVYIHYHTVNSSETNTELNQAEETYENESLSDIDSSIVSVVDSKIANMDEGTRIKTYFGRFIDAIENKSYEAAYSYLNEDYKKSYFPSIEEFVTYIENYYPKNKMLVEYESIERKGEIFVLYVALHDAIDDNFETVYQTVVVRENAINNFKISFSKDERSSEERSR